MDGEDRDDLDRLRGHVARLEESDRRIVRMLEKALQANELLLAVVGTMDSRIKRLEAAARSTKP